MWKSCRRRRRGGGGGGGGGGGTGIGGCGVQGVVFRQGVQRGRVKMEGVIRGGVSGG